MRPHIFIGCIVVAIVGMWMLLTTTSPATVHPLVILLFFLLLYTAVMGVMTCLLYLVSKHLSAGRTAVAHSSEFLLRRSYLYASVVAFAPVIILAMRSVGAASNIDMGLVVTFETLALFYVWRRS
jgi:hypothetical protein